MNSLLWVPDRGDSTVWERIWASAGLLFFAIFVTAFGLDLTDFTDPRLVQHEEIVGFVRANRTRLGQVATMYALAGMVFLWFLGRLRSVLVRLEPTPRLRSIRFGAGILIAGLMLVLSGLSSRSFSLTSPPSTSRPWSPGGCCSMPAVDSSGSHRSPGRCSCQRRHCLLCHGALPRWLGWFGLLAATWPLPP